LECYIEADPTASILLEDECADFNGTILHTAAFNFESMRRYAAGFGLLG